MGWRHDLNFHRNARLLACALPLCQENEYHSIAIILPFYTLYGQVTEIKLYDERLSYCRNGYQVARGTCA
jgi:hypothetical protein